jgi:hypothetical protein
MGAIRTWIVRNGACGVRHGHRTIPEHRHRLPRSRRSLATFYGAMLDWKVDVSSEWAEVRAEYGQCISFQQVEAYTPPESPNQEAPQQMHLDVGEAAVLDLGSTKHDHQWPRPSWTRPPAPPADGHRRVQRRRLRYRGALLDRRAAARTVTFPDTDIAAVGRGYGLEAITVRAVNDVADVRPWLEEAFSGH